MFTIFPILQRYNGAHNAFEKLRKPLGLRFFSKTRILAHNSSEYSLTNHKVALSTKHTKFLQKLEGKYTSKIRFRNVGKTT